MNLIHALYLIRCFVSFCLYYFVYFFVLCFFVFICETTKETENKRDRQQERQTTRETDNKRDRQQERQTTRETDNKRDKMLTFHVDFNAL